MVKLHYFKGRGRAETTRWMLAASQIDFVNIPIETPHAMAELRASGLLPFDQIPLLEIDGRAISQTTALLRYLARRGDFYGDTAEDALWCDMIAGVAADFAEAPMQAAFQASRDSAMATLQRTFEKFAPRLDARLQANGGEFIAAQRITFADIVLAEALSAYLDWVPKILDTMPGLARLQQRIIAMPGIAAYLDSPQRWPVADSDYVINVASVLQRALPSHFPDPYRFVPQDGASLTG